MRLRVVLAFIFIVAVMPSWAVDSSVLTRLEATTDVDDFNYVANPISAHDGTWTDKVITGDTANLATNGSVVGCDGSLADCSAYKNNAVGLYGSNMAAMITLAAKNATGDGVIGIYFALQGAGLGSGTPNGYRGEIRIRTTTDEFRVQRVDAGTLTVISSGTLQEVSAGDKFAVVRNGSVIELWWKTGSTWSQMVTVSDSTYTAGGRLGLEVTDLSTSGNTMDDLKAMNLSGQKCIGCGTDRKIIGDR